MKPHVAFVLFGLMTAPAVSVAVPSQMNVQGRLLDAGSPMTGSHPASFKIYDDPAAGSFLWSETSSLNVQSGIFTAVIGAVTPIPTIVFDNQPRWLEVTVDGTTLTPRLQLTTSAYAFKAQHADTAAFALNAATTGDNLWSTDGTNAWRSTGNVGVDTSSPDASLDVRGLGEFSDDGATPDSKSYATLGVTRAYANTNQSYLDLTQQGNFPWSFGVDGLGSLIIGAGSASPARTIPNPFVRVRSSDGAVGIGLVPYDHQLAVLNNVDVISYGSGAEVRLRNGQDLPNYQGAIRFNYNYNNAFGIYTWADNRQIFGASADGASIFFPMGNVSIAGNLTVSGTKCRLVKTAFGDFKMNADESAHALFMDDQPSARLVSGRCRVNLSPKFLATVTVNGKYPLAVNVTFYGQHGGEWYVQRDATGFTVIDPTGSNAELSWQVIGRQKGYEDLNLEPVAQTSTR